MKIKITGNVFDKNGQLFGVQDLPESEALRLIKLKKAVPATSEDIITQELKNEAIENGDNLALESLENGEKLTTEAKAKLAAGAVLITENPDGDKGVQVKVKPYKQMNCLDQTAYINALTSIKELEELVDDTKPTIKPVIEERIKILREQVQSSKEGTGTTEADNEPKTGENE